MIDKNKIAAAEQVLIDNGIESDEASIVLQAIGYVLLDEELYKDAYDRLPDTYAEIEYEDMDSAEAVLGSRWDDMNYQHYMER